MNVWLRVIAKVHLKNQLLCSWSCPHLQHNMDCGNYRCTVFHEDLRWVTLPKGKEMLERCRKCRANTLRRA